MTATASLTRTRTATLSSARTKTASSSASSTSSSSASVSVTKSSRASGSDTASASTSTSALASISYHASLSASASWASKTPVRSASSTRSITFSSTLSQTSSLSFNDTFSASVSASQSTSAIPRTSLISSATNKPSTRAMKSFTSTGSTTMSSTSSISPTPSTTKSLGVQLVEETVTAMGVKFELTVSPLTADTLTVSTAFALRSWVQKIVFALPSSVSIDPLLHSHVIDSIFIAAVYEVSTGLTTYLNTSDLRNTIGNVYNSTGDILKIVGLGDAATPLTTAVIPTSSPSSNSVPSTAVNMARALENRIQPPPYYSGNGGGASASGRSRRRRLLEEAAGETFILTLNQTFKSGIATGIAQKSSGAAGPTVVFLFNILASNSEEVVTIMARLTTGLTQESLIAVGVSYVNAKLPEYYHHRAVSDTNFSSSNSTTNATTVILRATVDSNSVTSIMFNVKRSFYGVFLDWLIRHVFEVLLGTSIIISAVCAMTCLKAFRKKRSERATAKHLKAMVSAHAAFTKKIRQSIIKAKMLRALRRYTTLVWWVKRTKLAAIPSDFYLKLPSVLSDSGSSGGGGNSFINNNNNVSYEEEEDEEVSEVIHIAVSPEGIDTGRAHVSTSSGIISQSSLSPSRCDSPSYSTSSSAESTPNSNASVSLLPAIIDGPDAMLAPPQRSPLPTPTTTSSSLTLNQSPPPTTTTTLTPAIATNLMKSVYVGDNVVPLLKAQFKLAQRNLFTLGHAFDDEIEKEMSSGTEMAGSSQLEWESSRPSGGLNGRGSGSGSGGGGVGGGGGGYPSLEVSQQRTGLSSPPVRNALGNLGRAIILRPEAQQPPGHDV